mmetsp:Transcript_2330/g.8540  ORF Transcript_2330/g.8540 Transcript_2330/m.8540 type:complete len:392 (-) Transcript_2330:1144-2319(-)
MLKERGPVNGSLPCSWRWWFIHVRRNSGSAPSGSLLSLLSSRRMVNNSASIAPWPNAEISSSSSGCSKLARCASDHTCGKSTRISSFPTNGLALPLIWRSACSHSVSMAAASATAPERSFWAPPPAMSAAKCGSPRSSFICWSVSRLTVAAISSTSLSMSGSLRSFWRRGSLRMPLLMAAARSGLLTRRCTSRRSARSSAMPSSKPSESAIASAGSTASRCAAFPSDASVASARSRLGSPPSSESASSRSASGDSSVISPISAAIAVTCSGDMRVSTASKSPGAKSAALSDSSASAPSAPSLAAMSTKSSSWSAGICASVASSFPSPARSARERAASWSGVRLASARRRSGASCASSAAAPLSSSPPNSLLDAAAAASSAAACDASTSLCA